MGSIAAIEEVLVVVVVVVIFVVVIVVVVVVVVVAVLVVGLSTHILEFPDKDESIVSMKSLVASQLVKNNVLSSS